MYLWWNDWLTNLKISYAQQYIQFFSKWIFQIWQIRQISQILLKYLLFTQDTSTLVQKCSKYRFKAFKNEIKILNFDKFKTSLIWQNLAN